MLLGFDAEKAFDMVDWIFLEHMDFNDIFVKWIEIFYKKDPKLK